MESELIAKFEELTAPKTAKPASLRKRSADDKDAPPANGAKMSIKDRIKVREDAKPEKRIKVEAVAAPAPTGEEKPKEEKAERGKKDPAKVRCRFWPGCHNKECQFAHPKEQCPKFPFCNFGDKCIFIHPAVSVFPASADRV